MPDDLLAKLARNIERQQRYPPIVVRPHPELQGAHQILDGEQRMRALGLLGYDEARCYLRPCDDATALVLLGTLNALRGEDVPVRRAALLNELRTLLPEQDLALLLPESAAAIDETLALLNLDSEALLRDLELAAAQRRQGAPRLISFAVLPDDEAAVEAAVDLAARDLEGANRRGRALGLVCRQYVEAQNA